MGSHSTAGKVLGLKRIDANSIEVVGPLPRWCRLEGVIGHEMSHIKNYDVRLILIVSTLIGIAGLIASIIWRAAFYMRPRGRDGGQARALCLRPGRLPAMTMLWAANAPNGCRATAEAQWTLAGHPIDTETDDRIPAERLPVIVPIEVLPPLPEIETDERIPAEPQDSISVPVADLIFEPVDDTASIELPPADRRYDLLEAILAPMLLEGDLGEHGDRA